MPVVPRVTFDERTMPKPIVDGEIIEFGPRPHPAYRETFAVRALDAERSLDRLITSIDEAIDVLSREVDQLTRTRGLRDLRHALEDHEESCDALVRWAQVVAGLER